MNNSLILESSKVSVEQDISDEEIEQLINFLSKNVDIREVKLDSVNFESERWKDIFTTLTNSVQIESLLISRCPISLVFNDLCAFLKLCTNLVHLKISNTDINESDFSKLCEILKNHTSLRKLDLKGNIILLNMANSLLSLVKENNGICTLFFESNDEIKQLEEEIKSIIKNNYENILSSSSLIEWKIENSYVMKEARNVSCMLYTSNDLVWIGTVEGIIYIWDPSKGVEQNIKSIKVYDDSTRGSKRRINGMVEGDDKTIWCITDERYISLLSLDSLTVIKKLIIQSHQAITICRYKESIYLGGTSGEISCWDILTHECVHTIVLDDRHPISSIYVDDKYIWVGTIVHPKRTGYLLLFSYTDTMKLISAWEAHNDIISNISKLDSHIISCSVDGSVKMWDISKLSSNELSEDLISDEEKEFLIKELKDYKNIMSKHISCGNTIILCGRTNYIVMWDPIKNLKSKVLASEKFVNCLHKIDDNSFISGDENNRIMLWKKK